MAARLPPLTHPRDGQFGRGKAQKEEFYHESLFPPHRYVSRINPTTQSGFKRKTVSMSNMFKDFLQHQPPGLNRDAIRVKGSKPGGNQIRVDKNGTVGLVG